MGAAENVVHDGQVAAADNRVDRVAWWWGRHVEVFLFGVMAFVWWATLAWSFLPFGSTVFNGLALLWIALTVTAVIAAPVSLLLALPRRSRPLALRILAAGVAIVAGTLVGGAIGRAQRQGHMAQIPVRGAPLVRAIRSYEHSEHHPPRVLGDLVPRYLSRIPSTGFGGHPDWFYRSGPFAGPEATAYGENAWVLELQVGGRGAGFYKVRYLPNLQYPTVDLRGRPLQRVGDWAYVPY